MLPRAALGAVWILALAVETRAGTEMDYSL